MSVKLRLRRINNEVNNIVNILASTGSTALVNKLKELEHDKTELEFGISCLDKANIVEVTYDDISRAFDTARFLLKNGQLVSAKRLVEQSVDN